MTADPSSTGRPATTARPAADVVVQRIGRLAAVARGLEREGAYNGAKLVRAALARELIRHAQAATLSGGAAVAASLEDLLAADADALPAVLLPALRRVPDLVRSGSTIGLDAAPRVHVCRGCGEVMAGEAVPVACPACEAPAFSFHEELPVWYLEPAEPGPIMAALAAGPLHVDEALGGRDDATLALPPAAGEWSARQTLEHLLFAEDLFAERVGRLLAEDGPDLAARAVWSETSSSDEGSTETGELASILAARHHDLRRATVRRLSGIPDAAWARAGQHPEWGRVTVLSQAAYFARHESSHLAQLATAAAGRVPGQGPRPRSPDPSG